MTEFTIPAPELARLTHNALAFMPARSAVKVCRLMLSMHPEPPYNDELIITATDLFTVGRDYAAVCSNDGGPNAHWIDLSRGDLQERDRAARGKKKEDLTIRIVHEDGLSVKDDNGAWIPFLDKSAQRNPEDLWSRVRELLDGMESGPNMLPPKCLTIDPKMLSAFGKVKPANGKECVADLYLRGNEGQILVKIGETFTGAIMPVDREEAEASNGIGPEGLWE
jgi:hypothetical protein